MEKMRLGDIFTITSGGTPNKKYSFYYENGNIPWVKTGDLKKQYLIGEVEFITQEGLDNSSAKLFPTNTVLLAMYGATIGACSILTYEASTNQACAAFLPNSKVLPEYLYYFLCSQKEKFIKDGVGGAQPNISAGYLKNVEMEIKTIEEQRNVIKVLNKVNYLIDRRNKQLEKIDELAKARFVELFGEWNSNPEPLKSFLKDITYGFTNPMPDAEEGPWKVTAKDVVNGKVNYDTARKTTVQAFEELTAKSKPTVGDVLLTKDGTLGRCAVVEEDGICVNQSVAVLKCNEKILPKFLAILLQMPEYQREMLKNAGGGTIKHIYITKVVDMLIVVPTISQQMEFLSFVEQTDKSKLEVQKSLEKLEVLKKSLMQKYFG